MILATLSATSVQAVMTVEGAIKGADFTAYIEHVLGPELVPGDVVVLDNLPAHKVASLAQRVAARGARLLYLPPYSPDFNPIEVAFSKLKTWLRTVQARTRQALETALKQAIDWVRETDSQNWFDHFGYHVH